MYKINLVCTGMFVLICFDSVFFFNVNIELSETLFIKQFYMIRYNKGIILDYFQRTLRL